MYERLYKKVTPNGVTVDKVIQPSVDKVKPCIGLIAGDEDSYEVCAVTRSNNNYVLIT